MKFLIAISCILAVASSSHVAVHPQHVPVITSDGVPAEPAANVAARAQHAAAHIEAHARNGDYAVAYTSPIAYSTYSGYNAPIAYSAGYAPFAYSAGYTGPQHLPVITANGVPAEPAANVAARAEHAAAHIEAKARNGDYAVVAPVAAYSAYAGPVVSAYSAQHYPLITSQGVPAEPAANVAARAQHAAAHVEAKVRNGDVAVAAPLAYAAYSATPVAYSAYSHAYPALAHDGQPLETPEVVAAKSSHFAAHIEARARNGAYAYAPVAYSTYAAPYYSAYSYPAVSVNGVPLETPEVVAAKADHFAAHVEARARNNAW